MAEKFKLTYATMFNPPEEMHTRFDEALASLKAGLGKEYGMIINGQDRFASEKFEDRSPVNTDTVLGAQSSSGVERDEVAAARGAAAQSSGSYRPADF